MLVVDLSAEIEFKVIWSTWNIQSTNSSSLKVEH